MKYQFAEVDMAIIGAAPFRRHSRRKDTDVFITSLYKIKRIIKEKRSLGVKLAAINARAG